MARTIGHEAWSLEQIFNSLDHNGEGSLSVYDIERIILQQRKGGSRSIVEDIDLLVAMYDRSGSGKIQYIDFLNELIPRLQA